MRVSTLVLNQADPRIDHLVYDCAPLWNPLVQSTYQDEDYVGKIKKLAMLSSPQRMGQQVLERYSAYVCVRWLRQLKE